ncbi:MAG: hypothetical protein JXR78_17425 [Victivallales bacterium]|nr:hypothetical protein [Victivallales bacterium]
MKETIGVLAAALLMMSSSLVALELPEFVKIDKNGTLTLGRAQFSMQMHYGNDWKLLSNRNWKISKSATGKEGAFISGEIMAGKVAGTVMQTIRAVTENEFTLTCSFELDNIVDVKNCSGTIYIPVNSNSKVFIDDKPFSLPQHYDKLTLYTSRSISRIRLVLTEGISIEVIGMNGITIQDNRKFKSETFALRLPSDPDSGKVKSSRLDLKFKINPLETRSVDIAAAATRGFVYDGKQGWTDQGSDNDLRALRQSRVDHHGLNFELCDPARNDGKAAIVIGGKNQTFLNSTGIQLSSGIYAGAVNLLHASAWTPAKNSELGSIEVQYADGTVQKIPVVSGVDCGNWWNPVSSDNSIVAWLSENAMSTIGLYVSSFALNKNNPVSISFKVTAPRAVWMIVGVTLSNNIVLFDTLLPVDKYIVPGGNWVRLDFDRQIKKDSPLDFSRIIANDAPAGKYGRVKVADDGTLTFEKAPGRRVRFYGVNLCFSASFMPAEEVEKLAETLVRIGYNSVRIHHQDTLMLDRNAPDSLTISEEKMDQLDYFLATMKEKGIYVTTDFFANRVFKKGDNIPECDSFSRHRMKSLIPISKAAMENWKEFARRWMTHPNPYTGLTWGEDPAIYMINLVNEDNLSRAWKESPAIAKIYETRFQEWARINNINNARASNNNHDFRRFLYELQKKCIEEQIDFIKNELKLKLLVTSLNCMSQTPYTLLRNKFDVVDNHEYFDHPGFPERGWTLPFSYRQNCAISRQGSVPRKMMASRIFGKPFMVTEFNYCKPNIYRAEGGPLIGAYAALQNWDGLYRFAWSHNSSSIIKPQPAVGFDAVNEPLAQLTDRIIMAMFLRGDVKAADLKVSYAVSEDMFKNDEFINFPHDFTLLGLVTQIGSNVVGQAPVPGILSVSPSRATLTEVLNNKTGTDLWREAIENKQIESLTGQILMESRHKRLIVNSPLTESITLQNGNASAGVMSIANADRFQTVCAISLDKKALSESTSILLLHLTNIANSRQLFGNEAMTLLKSWGNLPLLVARGQADIAFKSGNKFNVTALALDGSPKGNVSGKFENGRFYFKINTAMLPGGVMAYHLTR